ncbi:MAG: sigma-70 family RNA polymerase sigma factor, partial [Pseudomonadota bacterium]
MSNIHKTFRHNELTIKRIIARYRPVQEDIDDLAQDVFVKSYAAEREKHILNPKAFIFKTAKHIAISEAKRKRHATTDYIEDFGGTDVYRDEDQLTAEHRLDSRQKFQALLDAIATLSPECRHALILKKIEGLKFKEIAAK